MFRLPELRRLFRLSPSRSLAADVEAELEFHLAERIDELVRAGLPLAAARAEALRRFGDIAAARRTLTARGAVTNRRRALIGWAADLARDVRFALRGLRRAPLFTVTALTVLGLGIGLTTAMVSVLDRAVLNPLPFPNADRLGRIWLAWTGADHDMRLTPNWDAFDALGRVGAFDRLEGYQSRDLMLEIGENADLVGTRSVTPGLLPMLGARIALGRGIAEADTAANAPRVAVLSAGTWRHRFAAAPTSLASRSCSMARRSPSWVSWLPASIWPPSIDGPRRRSGFRFIARMARTSIRSFWSGVGCRSSARRRSWWPR